MSCYNGVYFIYLNSCDILKSKYAAVQVLWTNTEPFVLELVPIQAYNDDSVNLNIYFFSLGGTIEKKLFFFVVRKLTFVVSKCRLTTKVKVNKVGE